MSIDAVDEIPSDYLLQHGIRFFGSISAPVSVMTFILHYRSLHSALRSLWATYRTLDSQPKVYKTLALLILEFFWHIPFLVFVIPALKLSIYIVLAVTDLQICFIAYMAEGAFKALKKSIKEHYKLLTQTSEARGLFLYFDEPCLKQGPQRAVDLYKLRQVHKQLFHAMSTVNRVYNIAALVITFSCRFLFTIYLYRWIASKFNNLQLIYALLCLQKIFYICYRFEVLKRIEQATTDMVNGLDKSPLDARTRAEFKLFLIQLKSHRMVFNSIQMFNLDFTLITSMFTTTITYLMLLQQFS